MSIILPKCNTDKIEKLEIMKNVVETNHNIKSERNTVRLDFYA